MFYVKHIFGYPFITTHTYTNCYYFITNHFGLLIKLIMNRNAMKNSSSLRQSKQSVLPVV